MEKKVDRLLAAFYMLLAVGSRIAYFMVNTGSFSDPYGYYAHSVIKQGSREPMLTSGLAYAYTQNLSKLLGFSGNRLDAVMVYQTVLQVLWILLLFFSMSLLFGKAAGYVSGLLILGSPFLLKTLITVTPENYLMLRIAVLMFLLGIFVRKTEKSGWHRSSLCELCLMVLGFGTGVVITWNFLGFVIVLITAYVLACNKRSLKQGLWEERREADEKHYKKLEKYQLMPVGSQLMILTVGTLIGMYATLMKYTGLTGISVGEQFLWWTAQYQSIQERLQDVSVVTAAYLGGSLLLGEVLGLVIKSIHSRRQWEALYSDVEVAEDEKILKDSKKDSKTEETKTEETETTIIETEKAETVIAETVQNVVVTEDGRQVKLLDNPLPVPKRHIKREMEFDLNDFSDGKDDFDI